MKEKDSHRLTLVNVYLSPFQGSNCSIKTSIGQRLWVIACRLTSVNVRLVLMCSATAVDSIQVASFSISNILSASGFYEAFSFTSVTFHRHSGGVARHKRYPRDGKRGLHEGYRTIHGLELASNG